MRILLFFILSIFLASSSFAQSTFMKGVQCFEGSVTQEPNDQLAAEHFEKAFMEERNLYAGLVLNHMRDKKLLIIPLKDSVLTRLDLLKKLKLPFLEHYNTVPARSFLESVRAGKGQIKKRVALFNQMGSGGRLFYVMGMTSGSENRDSKLMVKGRDGSMMDIESIIHETSVSNVIMCPEFILDIDQILSSTKSYDQNQEISLLRRLAKEYADKPINTDGQTEYEMALSLKPKAEAVKDRGALEDFQNNLANQLMYHAAMLGHIPALKDFFFINVLPTYVPYNCCAHLMLHGLRIESDQSDSNHSMKHSLLEMSQFLKSIDLFPKDDKDIEAFALVSVVWDKMHELVLREKSMDAASCEATKKMLNLFVPKIDALLTQPLHPSVVDLARFVSTLYYISLGASLKPTDLILNRLATLKYVKGRGKHHTYAAFLETYVNYSGYSKGTVDKMSPEAIKVARNCLKLPEEYDQDIRYCAALTLAVAETPLYGSVSKELADKLWAHLQIIAGEVENVEVNCHLANLLIQHPNLKCPHDIKKNILTKLLSDLLRKMDQNGHAEKDMAQFDTRKESVLETAKGSFVKLETFKQYSLLARLIYELSIVTKNENLANKAFDIFMKNLEGKKIDLDLVDAFAHYFKECNGTLRVYNSNVILFYSKVANYVEAAWELFQLLNSEGKRKKIIQSGALEDKVDGLFREVISELSKTYPFLACYWHLTGEVSVEPPKNSGGDTKLPDGYLGEKASDDDRHVVALLLALAEECPIANFFLYEMLTHKIKTPLLLNRDLAKVHLVKAAELGNKEATAIIKKEKWDTESKKIDEDTRRNLTKTKTRKMDKENVETQSVSTSSSSSSASVDKATVIVHKRDADVWEKLCSNDNVKIAELKRFLGNIGTIKQGAGSRIKVILPTFSMDLHGQHDDLHGTTLEKGRQRDIAETLSEHLDIKPRESQDK